MSIKDTSYFREFLDLAFLWMRDKGTAMLNGHRPTRENEELSARLKETLPTEFFELCPMHLLGRLVDFLPRAVRDRRLVLTVSLNPGRNAVAERLENQHGIFDEFGEDGQTLIDRTANYFQTIGANGSFWRIISRVSRQSLIDEPFDQQMVAEWMEHSVAHVDHWPLRLANFDEFIRHENQFPAGFGRTRRREMLIELIVASEADVTLVLGTEADLALSTTELPPLPNVTLRHPNTNEIIDQLQVYRVQDLARCYRIPHPNRRGTCNVQWDNIAQRIHNDMN